MSDSSWSYGLQPTSLLYPWGFSRQEYRSGLPCPPPGELPNPETEPASPVSPALAGRFLTSGPLGKPPVFFTFFFLQHYLTLLLPGPHLFSGIASYHQRLSKKMFSFSLQIFIVFILILRSSNKLSFPGRAVVKNSPANEEDTSSIPGLGRSSREGR